MAILDRKTFISFPKNSKYSTISTGIESGTMSVDEILLTGNIEFGQYNANKFEVVLYQASDITGETIYVYQEDKDHNVTPIFTGVVDSCKRDRLGYYRQIVAYDELYTWQDIDVAVWWNRFWKSHRNPTLKAMRESLCSAVGIRYSTATLFNDNFPVKANIDVKSMRFKDMLTLICELSLVCPNMSRTGVLEFVPLYVTSTTPIHRNVKYEGENSSFETFTTKKITSVHIIDQDDEAFIYPVLQEEDDTNPYIISGNIFIYDKSDNNKQLLAMQIYDKIKNISYTPFSIKLIESDRNIKLGDIIYTKSPLNTDVISFVATNDLSGSLLVEQTIANNSSETLTDTSQAYNSEYEVLKKKIEQVAVDRMGYYSYRNEQGIEVSDRSRIPLFNIVYTTTSACYITFHAEIRLEVTTTSDDTNMVYNDCVARFGYTVNDAEVVDIHPTETWQDGKHTMHLMYMQYVDANAVNTLGVWVETNGGSLSIPYHDISAYLSGLGLVGEGRSTWDGKIICEDYYTTIPLGMPTINEYSDSLEVKLTPVPKIIVSDNYSVIPIQLSTIRNYIDNVQLGSTHNITILPTTNGTVVADTAEALSNRTIILTVTPDFGYVLNTIQIVTTSGKTIVPQIGSLVTFIMPNEDVTISATFKEG